jgi:2-amino-4-hydroxy-6-hydroxymethyldihydropteridine diphosphokinase/dihydropteroate synthase
VTPDSFSDGGAHHGVDAAVRHARDMVAAGATIIDVGGQSTRPGATRVSPEEELARVVPVVRALAAEYDGRDDVFISIDTFYGAVASAAAEAGADIINDVSGGTWDAAMLPTVARLEKPLPYVVMHVRGDPSNMQSSANTPYAGHMCDEVGDGLLSTARRCVEQGIEPWRLWIDPGIGFAKTSRANIELLRDLPRVRSRLAPLGGALMNAPMLVGASRKRFLGEISGKAEASERDAASIAALVAAVRGGADIVRVHNVPLSADASRVSDALFRR